MKVKGAMPNAEVHLSADEGDVLTWYARNKNPNDIPLVICYSMGVDFDDLTPQKQRARVFDIRKMLKESVNGVMENLGKLLSPPNLPARSIESSFRTRKGRGWAPPSWGRHR